MIDVSKSTGFLVFILCVAISKLVLTVIMFTHARNVKNEKNSEKKLKEIEEILSGSPMAIANQALGAIMIAFLLYGIYSNIHDLNSIRLKNYSKII